MRTVHIIDKSEQQVRQRFYVYQDLLVLHSEYFHRRIRAAEGEGEIVINNLGNIKPALFKIFVPWISSGSFLPFESTTTPQGQALAVHWIRLWQMGNDLEVRASLLLDHLLV